MRGQQRKLLDHIAAAGFSEDVVEYVRTWRILALGPHEYSYVAPRRQGKQRSMKGVQQFLYQLQQQPSKLKEGVRARKHLDNVLFSKCVDIESKKAARQTHSTLRDSVS